MANRTIYTRTYSANSAAQLSSRKGPTGRPLFKDELLAEFRNHANLWSRTPTALVSVSNRIIDTIQRAFQMHHRDGEHPANIWVVFIEAPPPAHRDGKLNKGPARIYRARDLAAQCQVAQEYQRRFRYEFVFEWGVPEHYVLHEISLQTLMDRGLRIQAPSTEALRVSIAREFEETWPVEVDLNLGFWARRFGARAPTGWIAHQLYYDCMGERVGQDSGVDRGVDTALVDWWLTDSGFVSDYKEYQRWREAKVDEAAWKGIELWETWYGDGSFQQISDEGSSVWDHPELSAKEDGMWREIEEEAVRIGL